MKQRVTLIFSLLMSGLSFSQTESEKPVYRDAETHDFILKKMKVNEKLDPFKKLTPSVGDDPSKKNQPEDLISSSDIISFNGVTTLVPKLAIIQIPDIYKSRINNHSPSNKVVGWWDFYKMNNGWITTVEVTRAQAEGKEPIAEGIVANYTKSRNLVIATYSSGPISMLSPETEEQKSDVKKENNNKTKSPTLK